MNWFIKVLALLLLGAVITGLSGCADSNATSNTMTPTETPSKDDLSHGWGPTPN